MRMIVGVEVRIVTSFGTRTRIFDSRVRRLSGKFIPGRHDIDSLSWRTLSVFRALFIARLVPFRYWEL